MVVDPLHPALAATAGMDRGTHRWMTRAPRWSKGADVDVHVGVSCQCGKVARVEGEDLDHVAA